MNKSPLLSLINITSGLGFMVLGTYMAFIRYTEEKHLTNPEFLYEHPWMVGINCLLLVVFMATSNRIKATAGY